MRAACSTLLLAAALGCSSVPSAREPTRVPPAKPPPPTARRFVLDARSLTVEATVHHAVATTIRFATVRGRIVAAQTDPEATEFEVTIDLRSGDSTPSVVADIAEGDFLHAERFPTATLRSTSVRRGEDSTFDVFVAFEIHGVVRTLRVPARLTVGPCSVMLTTEFSFDRRRFGIVAAGSLDDIVDDEVDVLLAVKVAQPCASR